MIKTFLSLMVLCLFTGMNTHADERVIVRSQWRTANVNEPSISYFAYNADQKLKIKTGIHLTEDEIIKDPDTGKCSDFLRRLTRFPLHKMLERKIIDRGQFHFYEAFAAKLSPDQVVFFDVAIPGHIELDFKDIRMGNDPFGLREQMHNKTVMENMAAFADHHLSDADYIKETSKFLETKASMWLVRNFVEDETGKIVSKRLPWQFEEAFNKASAEAKDGLHFELGRVASEKPEDAQTLFKASILTAANDVSVLGKNLSHSKVYVHAISPIHNRYYKTFGFKEVKALESGETLMQANLEELYRKLNPLQDYHETAPYLSFFNHDPVKTLEFRNRVRNAMNEWIEPKAKAGKPVLVSYHKDWYAFIGDDFNRMTEAERSRFIINSSSSPDVFAGRSNRVPDYVLKGQDQVNTIWALDPAELARDPNYIGKTISGVYQHYIHYLNEGQYSQLLGHDLIHNTPMVLVSSDASIVNEAVRLGATVTPVQSVKRTRSFGEDIAKTDVSSGFNLSFSADQVKRITKSYLIYDMIPDLGRGKFQRQALRMNGL